MPPRTCYNCTYVRVDPDHWLRQSSTGRPLLPRCANHPQWPGRLREVPGTPCEHYRPKAAESRSESRCIPLEDGHYAIVDEADYEMLTQWNWRYYNGYAARQEQRKTIYMHRQILNPSKSMLVDHINRNKLDNRRANLRTCTRRQNIHNQAAKRGSISKFKGVEYRRDRQKYFARIRYQGKRLWLGTFTSEIEAAQAYDRAAQKYFGPYAHLNFPQDHRKL